MSSLYTPRHRTVRRRRLHPAVSGAAAAAVAVVLLVGGQGTLARWSVARSAASGSFTTGALRLLTDSTHTGCSGTWAGGSSAVYIQPGDILTSTCTFLLVATGDHISGTIAAAPPTGATGVTLTVTGITENGAAVTSLAPTPAAGYPVIVTLRATVDDTATTAHTSQEDKVASLTGTSVTVKQTLRSGGVA